MRVAYFKQTKGFTLVELMITVVIIGVLAAVAIPSYYKYILKSKASEAPLLIKVIYDAEVVFASKGQISYRSETYGDVTCKPSPSFLSVCLSKLNSISTYGDDYTTTMGTQKGKLGYFFVPGSVTYSSSTNTCVMNESYGEPKYLDLQSEETSDFGSGKVSVWPQSSYFILRAKPDILLANQYGVDRSKTLMIASIGDLDGDNLAESSYNGGNSAGFVGCNYGANNSPSENYFNMPNISIYARGLYIDSEGDMQGTQMIKINELE